MPGQTLTLRFKNRSGSQHDFLCFQQGININMPNISALAWFAKPVANGVNVDFTWTTDYSFVWSEQGTLKPGITFSAQQAIPADPATANLVTFTNVNGAFQFGTPTAAGSVGSIAIDCDSTIPKDVAMIGIGMSGQGTHVVPAEPNFATVFSVRPEYWIAFGSYTPGQVLHSATMIHAQQVTFPVNVTGMTATLDTGNNWTIQQGLT